MENKVIKLSQEDSAIIFRNSNEIELILNDKDNTLGQENTNLTLAVMYALKNKEIRNLIEQYFEKKCLQIQFKAKKEASLFTENRNVLKTSKQPTEPKSNIVYLSNFKKKQYEKDEPGSQSLVNYLD